MLVVATLAVGFWILILSPKRQQANDLEAEVQAQQTSLAQAQSQVTEATAAKREFPSDYRQLVLLGKAVPASDDTASLLVELNRVADEAGVRFDSLQLKSSESVETASTGTPAPEAGPTLAVPASATVPPTEAEAALLPLGATIGSAGLAVMPYDLTFTGNFFQVADFIHGIDSLVDTGKSSVAVDGRLITLDGFALTEDSASEFPNLTASFAVTTYLVSPGQGVTAGATAAAPPATEASATVAPSPSAAAR